MSGPLGGPRPFSKDKKVILVLVGIDGPAPPRHTRVNMEEEVNRSINNILIEKGANIDIDRDTVNLVVEDNPTAEQRNKLDGGTLHIQQYGIKTELEEVSQGLVNAVHNTILDEVEKLGFNIGDAQTTVS